MLKKLLLAAVLAASASSVLANSAPYIGASVGEQTNTSSYDNARGAPVTLFAGYGGDVTNGIYLAAEIFGTPVTGVISDNRLRSTYGYGASFIPGVMISDHTLGYLRLGIVRTHFAPGGITAATITGGQAGLGMQTTLMQNWDVRGEYVYTSYNDISNLSGSPRADTFNLGLVYKFD